MYGKGTEEKPFQISPSSLGNFLDCPSCFLNHDMKIAKKPSGPFPQLPNGIDDSMRKVMTAAATNSPPFMPPAFAAIPHLAGCIPADRDLVGPTVKLENKDHVIAPNGARFTLTGKLDELFTRNNGERQEYIIADYKTKRSLNHASKPPHEAYVRQLRCYAMILRSNGFTVNDTALLINYYPAETLMVDDVKPYLEFTVDSVDVSPMATKQIQTWIEMMADVVEQSFASGIPPAKTPDCDWCSFRA